MKVNAGQIERALDAPPAHVRLFLLYGPDEAGSRAQARRLERSMGADAERIDLDGATLKGDPARLADEAASMSLFGGNRHIRVSISGDEAISAIEALLDSDASGGNPVVAIAGALKASSAILKRALVDPNVMACANYPLEDRDADQLAMAMARDHGLRLSAEAARMIANAVANDRGVMAREIEKLALYLDAAPDRPGTADVAEVEAIAAGNGEGELSQLVDAVMDGKPAIAATRVTQLADAGVEGIPLLRAVSRRVQLLAKMGSEVASGQPRSAVMDRTAKSLFWKEKEAVSRQFGRWESSRLNTAAGRLLNAERQIKATGSAGVIMAETELIAIARAAQRLR